ncbi:MAG: hypothetical protein CFE45_32045 [Burkholderiales bacterium PBB5]|nr:MAG: hypothetical protein CFE45_32045 [Burkholderiales bacterium PBB5]
MIDDLQIPVILCMGQDCGQAVRERLDASELVDEFVEQNSRRWRSTAHRSRGGVQVVTATHPAIASWSHEPTDPTQLIERAIARAGGC